MKISKTSPPSFSSTISFTRASNSPNDARLLKTNPRLRTKPQYVFPQYVRNGKLSTSVASSAFRSWVRAETGNQELTAHGLRHTLRDRLRKVEAPLELIDQIGGWKTVSGAGTRYGRGYDLEQLRRWLRRIAIKLD